MHRFGRYVVTALITFTLGIAFSFLTGAFSSKQNQMNPPAPAIHVERKSADTVSSMGGHGITADGFETHFFQYQYADGSFRNELRIFYDSPERATAELEKYLEETSEVVRRGPLFDEKGRQTGERVVAIFASQKVSVPVSAQLLWTDHSTLVIEERSSLKSILDEF